MRITDEGTSNNSICHSKAIIRATLNFYRIKKMVHKKIDRRVFLKGAAAVAGFPYIISSSALGKAGTVSPSNRLVVGVIGTGSMGRGDLQNFLSRGEVQVVAVCDVDKVNAREGREMVNGKYENRDCAVYGDYRELIGRGDLDVAVHAIPDHWHMKISVACARAGLDIHGQKPLSRTIKGGRTICDAVEKYGVIWQTGSWQRSVGDFHRAAELVRNGRIGKVKYVEIGLPDGQKSSPNFPVIPVPDGLNYDMWLGPATWRDYTGFGGGSVHWNWRWVMDYSGGQLTDWAGHHVDIAHWGLGLDRTGPIEIEGKGEYPKDGTYNTPYAYKFRCKYANGVEAVVANASQLPHGMGPCWYGEKGWIHVNRGGLWAEHDSVFKEVIGPNETKLYKSVDHVGNFLDCVKNRKETITPAEIAHRSLSVGLLGEIAMLTGRKLKWDPDKEEIIGDELASRYLSRPLRAPW